MRMIGCFVMMQESTRDGRCTSLNSLMVKGWKIIKVGVARVLRDNLTLVFVNLSGRMRLKSA